jgi:ribosomal protein S18 acetylase RimI-like enzyme
MNGKATDLSKGVRPLKPDDLERMIAIDQAHTGRPRRRFFEKRLDAAKRQPGDFVYVGIEKAGKLAGFAMARLQHGEFGRDETIASLDLVGVDPDSQDRGYGHALMDGVARVLRAKGVRQLHSQADWTNHRLMKYLDSSGFELAPRLMLERSVSDPLAEPSDEL